MAEVHLVIMLLNVTMSQNAITYKTDSTTCVNTAATSSSSVAVR